MLRQIKNFGIIGVICFFIDFIIFRLSNYLFVLSGLDMLFAKYYLISGILGFTISVIINYKLSMKFVFIRKDNVPVEKEFTIFVLLSIVGLVLNEIILYIGIDIVYPKLNILNEHISYNFAKNYLFKIVATGIVMVYNFITRKIFIEGKK